MKQTYSSMAFLVEHTNHSPRTNYAEHSERFYLLYMQNMCQEDNEDTEKVNSLEIKELRS